VSELDKTPDPYRQIAKSIYGRPSDVWPSLAFGFIFVLPPMTLFLWLAGELTSWGDFVAAVFATAAAGFIMGGIGDRSREENELNMLRDLGPDGYLRFKRMTEEHRP